MSSIDTALYVRLAGFAGLSALVSARIYPAPIPQEPTYPLVTLTQISGIRDYTMGTQTGLVDARFQVDIWDETSVGVRAVAEQVRLALSNYHGTSDSVIIDLILMEDETRFYEDDVELHRISQDYKISFREVQP